MMIPEHAVLNEGVHEMKFYLIRHGMTQDNIDLNFSGCQTDTPLLPEGIEMLDAVHDVPSDSILFVSPMIRARQTADIMFPGMEQIIIDDLREMNFGIFEAKNHKMLDGDPVYQAWLDSGGVMKIPEGESIDIFRKRVMSGISRAALQAAEKSAENVYIVAHGGTIMASMSTLTGEEYFDFNVPNGMGYVIELEADDAGNITSAGSYDRFCGGIRDGYRDWRPPQYTPSGEMDR